MLCFRTRDTGGRLVPLSIETEPVPLAVGRDGVIRIRGSRVTLDTIVAAFRLGSTAEEILHQYPSLKLADIYAVIAYYLRHEADVDTYLRQRQEQAQRVRAQSEARFDRTGVRERLLARHASQMATPDASSGE
ncbi:MAG: DUF433 domain-containing protein [Chloroflexi bacterium]|nr:DUF433 domain-containing protein [Chloroflexota bacterium]